MRKSLITLYLLQSFFVALIDGAFIGSTNIFSRSCPSSNYKKHQWKIVSPLPGLSSRILSVKSNQSILHSTKEDNPPPLPNTEDPYLILGILTPTADKRVIKRAYRRMALKYHPDVRINANSSEQQKKDANDDFAKINAAYAVLSGKSESGSTSASGSQGTSTSSSNQRGKYSYTPPHRRTGQQYTKSSYGWEDFIPEYDEDQYNTDGDSFGAIFSDLFSEIGNSAAGSGKGSSILNDFVSFLEGNFPSVGNTQQDEEDIILNVLLKEGSFDEIKNEFDDAKLLVKQLEGKERDLVMELRDLSKEFRNLGQTSNYMEQMRLEERRKEIEARKDIVEEYLGRAKLRLVKLKRRYDELRIDEELNSNTYRRTNEKSQRNPSTSTSSSTNDDEDWKKESFGSSRRGRGRSRSRSYSTRKTNYSSTRTSSNAENTASTSSSPNQSRTPYSTSTSTRSNVYPSKQSIGTDESMLPPHRRMTSRLEQDMEDKRRLREIKVDEEIDKMKKELGL